MDVFNACYGSVVGFLCVSVRRNTMLLFITFVYSHIIC